MHSMFRVHSFRVRWSLKHSYLKQFISLGPPEELEKHEIAMLLAKRVIHFHGHIKAIKVKLKG